jgi:hypothetical protein
MKTKHLVTLLLIVFLFGSCKKRKVQKLLVGEWEGISIVGLGERFYTDSCGNELLYEETFERSATMELDNNKRGVWEAISIRKEINFNTTYAGCSIDYYYSTDSQTTEYFDWSYRSLDDVLIVNDVGYLVLNVTEHELDLEDGSGYVWSFTRN